jgi:SAM-dependent methyltransferase
MMGAVLHEERLRAESFGADAARYDRTRPRYPDEMLDFLADGRRDVLDVGCGTGIVSALFVARGCEVLGIEPDPRMAEFARAQGLTVEPGRFEEWDPRERRFDLLVAGQAWHWVDPEIGAVRAAVALRSGGRVGLFWNVARHHPEIEAAFSEEYRMVGLDIDQHSIVMGRGTDDRFPRSAAGLRATGAFDAIEQREYPWEREYTTASWLENLRTHSDHATLPPETLAALLEGIGAAIDERGGSFTVTYRAVLVTALRT